jgi:indole-3-glycerol phosphate synthase
MNFLSNILKSTRQAVDVRRQDRPLQEVLASLANMPPRPDEWIFLEALRKPGMAVIAEFKRASPSEGSLAENLDIRERVSEYERGGADALSVLTEQSSFHGSLADLRAARATCDLPILDKDFIVDEYQVYEAAEAGADAILLIVAALQETGNLRSLYDLAHELHLDVLVEIRSARELTEALDIKADLVGINNRRLQVPSEVDIDTTYQLIEQASKDKRITIVSESGIKTRKELDALAAVGVDAALIGTALMKASDPEARCRELTGVSGDSKGTRQIDHPAFVA